LYEVPVSREAPQRGVRSQTHRTDPLTEQPTLDGGHARPSCPWGAGGKQYDRQENTGPHDAETGAAAARWASAKYSVGSTTSTSSVAEISPPMMTTASGFCVSEPMPCESAIGSSPSIASSAVISTVRIRIS